MEGGVLASQPSLKWQRDKYNLNGLKRKGEVKTTSKDNLFKKFYMKGEGEVGRH